MPETMPLGASALPPKGYVEFCERRPQDCGANTVLVLAAARQADAERAELMAELGPSMPPVVMPAALTQASSQGAAPGYEVALVREDDVQAMVFETSVTFVDCPSGVQSSRDTPLRMSPRLWSLINRVNGEVNSEIQSMSDLANYGRDDYWNTPLEDGRRAGDCEDYVLEKQRALIAAGVPREALNIALVVTRWGENHAVLLVATTEGEYVLDNLSPWVVPWRSAPYRWMRRQVNGEAFNWVMIDERTNPLSSKGLLIALAR